MIFDLYRMFLAHNTEFSMLITFRTGQVAQAARLDSPGSIPGVGGWRLFFTPSCPDCPGVHSTTYKSEYRGISPGVKAAERRTSRPNSS